jgi:hypothetical protein
MTDLSAPPSSYAARNSTPQGDLLELTHDSLDEPNCLSGIVHSVRRDSAGAVALFIGTTRDEFQGDSQERPYRLLPIHSFRTLCRFFRYL